MTSVFETEDLGEAHEMLNRTYGRMRLTATGDRHRLRLSRTVLGPIGLHRVSFTMRFVAEVPPTGLVPVGRSLSGGTTRRTASHTTVVGPGDLFLAALPDHEVHAVTEDHDSELACFPPAILASVADTAPGLAPKPIQFTGFRPVSARAAATWNELYDYLRDHLAGTPIADEPLVSNSAARLLAAVTLATFPNTSQADPAAADRRDAHPETLRRAIAFIEDNAHRDITPADIARAARVTIRALQLSFRRHLDTTPSAYLRRVRLEHAHRQLAEADPAAVTVSTVAGQWGFASHSRFTARYRAAYGVPPSHTLHRR